MPTSTDKTTSGAKARAERHDDDTFTSKDTFENPSLKTLANTATVEDGQGIERVVGVSTDAFVPAPTEATKEQKAAATKLEKILADAKETRLAQLKGDVKDEDKQPNVPGDGGSQTAGSANPGGSSTDAAKDRA